MAERVPVTTIVRAPSALGCYDAAEDMAKQIVMAIPHRKVSLQQLFFEWIKPGIEQHDMTYHTPLPIEWEGQVTFHFDVESKDPMDINNFVINEHVDTGE